ncbi:uncharacterized protein LOC141786096 isoform X2 [Halichoeres trimaculatus]|uniref:uncharacterized protein LOC141786096 isoform X2 n=1 Tax=Halichoeres trimaculatus TaxID=147232 RepID=UPI003D9E38FD
MRPELDVSEASAEHLLEEEDQTKRPSFQALGWLTCDRSLRAVSVCDVLALQAVRNRAVEEPGLCGRVWWSWATL